MYTVLAAFMKTWVKTQKPLLKQTIQLGANQTAYFAARAALQAGQILEKRGQKQEAIAFYEQCLAMEEHSYKNSLDQRAKAGIARCK